MIHQLKRGYHLRRRSKNRENPGDLCVRDPPENEGLSYVHGDDDADTNAESIAGSRSSHKVAGLTFKSGAGRGAADTRKG